MQEENPGISPDGPSCRMPRSRTWHLRVAPRLRVQNTGSREGVREKQTQRLGGTQRQPLGFALDVGMGRLCSPPLIRWLREAPSRPLGSGGLWVSPNPGAEDGTRRSPGTRRLLGGAPGGRALPCGLRVSDEGRQDDEEPGLGDASRDGGGVSRRLMSSVSRRLVILSSCRPRTAVAQQGRGGAGRSRA